jgi:hypothetical protein
LAEASVGMGIVAGLSEDALAAWVAASCARQGVALKVTDVAVIADVVSLLNGAAADPGVRVSADGTAAALDQRRQTRSTRAGSNERAPGVPGAMTA